MWFLFGFITLISFAVYLFVRRIRANWSATRARTTNKKPYIYQIARNKGRAVKLLLGVDAPKGYDFALKAEGDIDRMSKWLGISEEFQCGGMEFDSAVYIVSDDKRFHTLLGMDSALQNAILELMQSIPAGYSLKEIRCNSGRLWVRYKPVSDLEEYGVNAIADEAVPRLQAIADKLATSPYTKVSAWRDPFVYKAAIILSLSTAMAINGGLHLLRLDFIAVPLTLDTKPLIIDAVRWGLALVVVLAVAALALLGRSARTHLVLMELLLIGSFGAMATAFAELRDANMEFDKAEGISIERSVLSKKHARRRKSPDKYYIWVQDWSRSGQSNVKLEITAQLYGQVSAGEKVLLQEKPGFLNYRWLVKIEKVPGR